MSMFDRDTNMRVGVDEWSYRLKKRGETGGFFYDYVKNMLLILGGE